MSWRHKVACEVLVAKIFRAFARECHLLLLILRKAEDSVTLARTASEAADMVIGQVQERINRKAYLWDDDNFPEEPNEFLKELGVLLHKLRDDIVLPLRAVAGSTGGDHPSAAVKKAITVAEEIHADCEKRSKGARAAEAGGRAAIIFRTIGKMAWIVIAAFVGGGAALAAFYNHNVAESAKRRTCLIEYTHRTALYALMSGRLGVATVTTARREQYRLSLLMLFKGTTNAVPETELERTPWLKLVTQLSSEYGYKKHLTEVRQIIFDVEEYLADTPAANCTSNKLMGYHDLLRKYESENWAPQP